MPKKSVKQTYAAAGWTATDILILHKVPFQINDERPRILNRVARLLLSLRLAFRVLLTRCWCLKAEEPGSKQLLAKQFNKIDNIGFD